jgi:Uncharacterised nucleotidyltransferase
MPEAELSRQPIDEAALLLTCLRDLPFLVPHDTDWQALLDMGSAHGVLLLLNRSLLEKKIEIPGFFAAAVRAEAERAEIFAGELQSVLQHFAQRGIESLPLKGPALAAALHGDATIRPCDDLDLLVRPRDFSAAESALIDLGFIARPKVDDYHRKFLRDDLMIELHFDVASPRSFPFDLDGVWNRAGQDIYRDVPMRVMSNHDLVLFLCLHGLKHGFSRLIWIMDLARALEKVPHRTCEEMARSARRQGLELPLLIGCEIVRQTLAQQLPPELEAIIAGSPEVAEKARRAVAQLLTERTGENNDPEIWSFYLQMEPDSRQKWRRRLSFFTATVEDNAWAERHGFHHRLTPVLRPLRLLRKYGPARVWRILFPPSSM